MTPETLNEQQGFLVNQLIAQHEKDIRLEKGLSFGNGAIVSAVFITMLLVAAHLIGMIDLIGTTGGVQMSEKPVAWQTDIHSDFNACMHREYCRELKRQRDAAVEALKAIGDLDWPGQFSVEEYANRVLREIEGKS